MNLNIFKRTKILDYNEHKWTVERDDNPSVVAELGPHIQKLGPCSVCHVTWEEFISSRNTRRCKK